MDTERPKHPDIKTGLSPEAATSKLRSRLTREGKLLLAWLDNLGDKLDTIWLEFPFGLHYDADLRNKAGFSRMALRHQSLYCDALALTRNGVLIIIEVKQRCVPKDVGQLAIYEWLARDTFAVDTDIHTLLIAQSATPIAAKYAEMHGIPILTPKHAIN